MLRDDGDVVALAPFLQLFARGSAESVARGQQYRFALVLKMPGQFTDGGGFARAVDPAQHDDERFVHFGLQGLCQRGEQLLQRLCQRLPQLSGFVQILFLDLAPHIGQQAPGCVHAHVGGNENGLQFFVQFVVDLAAGNQQGGQLSTGTRQTGGQTRQPAF